MKKELRSRGLLEEVCFVLKLGLKREGVRGAGSLIYLAKPGNHPIPFKSNRIVFLYIHYSFNK